MSIQHQAAFGAVSLSRTAPATRGAKRCDAQRYHCGRHGTLTVMAIARLAGTSKTAIYQRIKKGCKGAALCEGRWSRQKEIRRSSPPRRHVLMCALKIATSYPDRLPTVEEIQQVRAMSKQNAQVWRQAMATARRDLLHSTTGREEAPRP